LPIFAPGSSPGFSLMPTRISSILPSQRNLLDVLVPDGASRHRSQYHGNLGIETETPESSAIVRTFAGPSEDQCSREDRDLSREGKNHALPTDHRIPRPSSRGTPLLASMFPLCNRCLASALNSLWHFLSERLSSSLSFTLFNCWDLSQRGYYRSGEEKKSRVEKRPNSAVCLRINSLQVEYRLIDNQPGNFSGHNRPWLILPIHLSVPQGIAAMVG